MKVLLDAKTAIVTRDVFEKLPEYSCTVPTGVFPGKMWKRARNTYNGKDGWLLGMYQSHPIDPDRYCVTYFRDLIVV